MDETTKIEGHLSSAAAFVEGGIQEACDDACSICLEAFTDSDPSSVRHLPYFFFCTSFTLLAKARFYLQFKGSSVDDHASLEFILLKNSLVQVTGCKHEFHLQCILEWYTLDSYVFILFFFSFFLFSLSATLHRNWAVLHLVRMPVSMSINIPFLKESVSLSCFSVMFIVCFAHL